MEVLKEKDSQKISALKIADSVISIPPDYNPEEIFGSFVCEQLPSKVPITLLRPSLISWLKLTERVYQRLIEIGQSEIATQILPRGGQGGNLLR